jgi:hypothetical protein
MEVVAEVRARAARGETGWEISKATGVSRRTVTRWLSGRHPARVRLARGADVASLLVPERHAPYSYLLGLYLGDGHLAEMGRGVLLLRLTLDARYPLIIREAAAAVGSLMPTNRVGVRPRRDVHAVDVSCYSTLWPLLFPQHGPGRKHERTIALEPWQVAVTSEHPRSLIRGLIHSDGSRFIAHQRRNGCIYRYPRYCFANRSSDILRIFCDHLDMLDVAWTRSSLEQVQIAQRDSVSRLDFFIGPKR